MIKEKENIRESIIKLMMNLESMSHKQAKVTYHQNSDYYKNKYKVQLDKNYNEDKEFEDINMEDLKQQLQLNCSIKVRELNK